MTTTLKITDGRGLHLTFENGVTISIQIGGGNYGDNYQFPIGEIRRDNPLPKSSRAEVAMWAEDKNMIQIGPKDGEYRDTIMGYVPIDRVLDLVFVLRLIVGRPTGAEINAAISQFWPSRETV